MSYEKDTTTTTTNTMAASPPDTTGEDTQESSSAYRPAEHFLDLYGGKNKNTKYLPVAHRVHWFNQTLPGSFEIRTEIVYHAPDKSVTVEVERWVNGRKEITQVTKPGELIVKATVIDHAHFKQATAHKYECVANFVDALEKAETGAIGRALALLGYGTLAAELDEGRIVDSPVEDGEGQRARREQQQNGAGGVSSPASPLARALAIPGVKKGVTPPPPVASPPPATTGKAASNGGKTATAPVATPTPVVAPPPPSPPSGTEEQRSNGAGAAAQATVLTEEEKRGRIKDYELSVPFDIFSHFILVLCKQPAKRSEWDIDFVYEQLMAWQHGGEQAWRSGRATPDVVEKLKNMAGTFPKPVFAAFKTRLPFLLKNEKGEGGNDEGTPVKTFSDCTTDEVISAIELAREAIYLHDLGLVYDTVVDPSTRARVSFHHLKTTYSVDHPLDLFAPSQGDLPNGGGDPLVTDGARFAYQTTLEASYSENPTLLEEKLRKRYATRLPVSTAPVAAAPASSSVS